MAEFDRNELTSRRTRRDKDLEEEARAVTEEESIWIEGINMS